MSIALLLASGPEDYGTIIAEGFGTPLFVGLIHTPISVAKRLSIIAADFYGIYDPEAAAGHRQSVFDSPSCHGRSLLHYLYGVAQGDPSGVESPLEFPKVILDPIVTTS